MDKNVLYVLSWTTEPMQNPILTPYTNTAWYIYLEDKLCNVCISFLDKCLISQKPPMDILDIPEKQRLRCQKENLLQRNSAQIVEFDVTHRLLINYNYKGRHTLGDQSQGPTSGTSPLVCTAYFASKFYSQEPHFWSLRLVPRIKLVWFLGLVRKEQ